MSARETILALFVLVAIAGSMLWWLRRQANENPRYRKKNILTGTDLKFFYRLQRALPHCVVCPRVAVSSLIMPTGTGRARQAALAYIAAKKVGYAVFDENMQLLAVVELNHRSHLTRKEVDRDAFFATAGIKTIRFHAMNLPSNAKIQMAILGRADPVAAQAPMSLRPVEVHEIDFRNARAHWSNAANAPA